MSDEDREFYEPERRPVARGTRCANHPDRETVTACEECARPVCEECAPLKGGGHVFCRECMAKSRLVDAEPRVLGAPAEEKLPAAPPSGVRTSAALILAVLALGLVAAALILWWRWSAL